MSHVAGPFLRSAPGHSNEVFVSSRDHTPEAGWELTQVTDGRRVGVTRRRIRFVFDLEGTRWMLYNGNGYGATGIALARWEGVV